MRSLRAWLAAGLAAAALIAAPKAFASPDPVSPYEQVRRMGRGVNVLGYDPLWSEPAKARFKPRYFKTLHDAGFTTVRVNLQAFAHMDGEGRLDPAWLKTLDGVVRGALAQGLTVILDEHDFVPCGTDPVACEPRLTAFWRQIGERYRDAPDRVLFEILNEPNGKLDDAAWNGLLKTELAEIRRTNPTRTVIVGPAFWNNLGHLDALALPEADRNLVVTVHYYAPMEFTHQGAAWNPDTAKLSGVSWGAPEDQARVDADFDTVQRWAKAHDRPILLGEFGAYEKADLASRVRYTSAVARAAEVRGWAWAYWQFDSDFIVYDVGRDAWVEPIRKALIPAG